MGLSTSRQIKEDDTSYQSQTTGGLEFKKALERSHYSSQSSQVRPSPSKHDQNDESQEEINVTRLNQKIP